MIPRSLPLLEKCLLCGPHLGGKDLLKSLLERGFGDARLLDSSIQAVAGRPDLFPPNESAMPGSKRLFAITPLV